MSESPSLKHVEGFSVDGPSARTKNADEFTANTAKIPKLWQDFHASNKTSDEPIFGVYSDFASDANDFYNLTVGLKSESGTVQVETGSYLVFEVKGPLPMALIETWKRIWAYFARETKYQRTYKTDFEVYSHPQRVAIYIGVS